MKTASPRSFASKFSTILFSIISSVIFSNPAKAQMVGIPIPSDVNQNDVHFGYLETSADAKIMGVHTSNVITSESEYFLLNDGVKETIDATQFLAENNYEDFFPYGISGDGLVVFGDMIRENPTPDSFNYSKGAYYKNGAFHALPISDDISTEIFASSFDGTIFTGILRDENKAFKFENNVITELPTLGGDYIFANAMSGDGSVITGHGENAADETVIFKYANGQMTDLGRISDNSVATGISYDGSTIIGIHFNDGMSSPIGGFKYTDANGFVDLGNLGGTETRANDVSSTGKVTVGYSLIAGDQYTHAFKHTDEDGMIDLGTLGGNNSSATSITPDGSVITGFSETGNGDEVQIFILRGEALDESVGPMVSVENTVQMLAQNSNQLNSVLNLKESLLNFSLNQDAKLFGKNGLHFAAGSRFASVDKSKETGGTLKLAYRFNENLRAGMFLDYGFNDDLPDNFKSSKNIPTTTVFATLGQNTDDSGLFLKLSASYNSANLDISRQAIVNTEAGKGRADLVSKGAMTQIGYGFKIGNNFQITPYIGARFSEITRKAYQETENANFPISFEEAKKKSTTALIGSNFELKLSQNLNSRLAIGMEKDLSASLDGYKGNIFYLGDFNLTPRSIKETRYSAAAGLSYKITETQEISLDVNYIKQSLQGSNAIIGYVNYAIGF